MLNNSHQIISDPPQNPQRKLGVRQQNAWHMLKFAQLGPPEAAWDTDNLVHFLVGQNPDCVDEMNERHDQVWGNIQLWSILTLRVCLVCGFPLEASSGSRSSQADESLDSGLDRAKLREDYEAAAMQCRVMYPIYPDLWLSQVDSNGDLHGSTHILYWYTVTIIYNYGYNYIYVCIYICTHIHTYIYTLHYITLHYKRLYGILLHYIFLYYIILEYTLHYTTLHYITLHYIIYIIHYIPFHCVALHCVALQDMTWHDMSIIIILILMRKNDDELGVYPDALVFTEK